MRSPTHDPDETSSLLGHQSQPPRSNLHLHRLKSHLTTPINPQHTELILLFCFTITGLLDSSTVFIWGSFASMQTGNTVYLGLGAMGADPSSTSRWYKAATSIGSFCLGSACFSAAHRWASSSSSSGGGSPGRLPRRWELCVSFAVQMGCVAAAAVMVTLYGSTGSSSSSSVMEKEENGIGWRVFLPLALVAFQSSGQAVSSRVLNRKALTSVVLTSIYCDLFSVPVVAGTGKRRADEWRRAGAILCLMLGVAMGGMWAKSSVGVMGALWMVVAAKGVIVLAWLVWRGDVHVDSGYT
ncbi:hypothetical protein ASPSYDRAFT_46766 [Aspergillus sydowii CBS 593.65]|uniref:DUF1275 domain protein n=1 Tax=Aspergillus sydowii CBS 593.65 TaxID=1036612 RepID=A0A1L9TDV1_9EURO|nr:uncharacterized protein ASPSYDRAFT_46766 [Aspergillus sydowii CBS 593.65]OJJ57609.1 hypothetical protein ASPSYDRAFT_46766 [Aspergillus sydowii CBS 593.65]